MDKGNLMWPPPPLKILPPQVAKKPADIIKEAAKEVSPFKTTLNTALTTTTGIGTILGLGMVSPNPEFTSMLTVFGLSGIVGYHTVWGVTPALHSPLMSVTNAISGITAVGGLLLMNGGYYPTNSVEVRTILRQFFMRVTLFICRL